MLLLIFSLTNSPSGGQSNCDNCFRNFLIAAFGIIAGWICIGACICCYHKRNGRPKDDNSTFVNSSSGPREQYTHIRNVFQSGMWCSSYYQYGAWHGPYQLSLSFNSHAMSVNGSGWDDIGEYRIDGIFSDRTGRMGLTKYYKLGTGTSQNLGHHVFIQLMYNAFTTGFEGKWYVQTKKYHGEDRFVLKLESHFV